MKTTARKIAASNFQLNTHAIGDSANTVLLKIYKESLEGKKSRWKIEHAQVVQESDFDYFKLGIIHLCNLLTQHLICIGQVRSFRKDRLKTHMLIKNYFKSGRNCFGTDFP
jgi:predicted amidohydrolase YtcJ